MYQAGLLGNLKLRKVKNEFTCNDKVQISINLYIYDIENTYCMILLIFSTIYVLSLKFQYIICMEVSSRQLEMGLGSLRAESAYLGL